MKDLLYTLCTSRIVWLLVFLVVGLHQVGKMDFEDALHQQNHYCRMVQLYLDSDGQAGWPDYKSQYAQNCAQEANSR